MSDFDRIEEHRDQTAGLDYEAHRQRVHASDVWHVTLLDGGHEITVEVNAGNKEQAKRAAKELHPHGHTVYVEQA